MKKLLSILGLVFALIILASGMFFIYVDHVGRALDKDSKRFVDATLPQIVSSWDLTTFEQYSDQATLEQAGTAKDQQGQYFAFYSTKLGNMLQFQGSEGEAHINYSATTNTNTITADYLVKAKFERGDATLSVTLLKTSDEWKIIGLHVDAAALLEVDPPSEVKIKYAYELADADRTHLIDGVKAIRYGVSVAQAQKLLGKPTYERDLVGKQGNFVSHNLDYYIKRVRATDVNNRDQFITLEFDVTGHLRSVVYSSMKPITGEVTHHDIEPDIGIELYDTKPPT